MNVYLDSRDLIQLVERRSAEQTDRFERLLLDKGGHLIFSMSNITECCAPLNEGNEQSSVMKSLNRLERMPHIYIAESLIPRLELLQAATAFDRTCEYIDIAPPFVPRFDQVISPFAPPETRLYLNYGLAETVFDLWAVDRSVLGRMSKMAHRLREIIGLDRLRKDYKRHEANFPATISRDLALYKIRFPHERVRQLAAWIYENPRRCPSTRLSYEAYHKLVRNLGDKVEDSDIEDFTHISSLPYVDAITLDNRMRGYLAQVDDSIGTSHSRRVYRNLDEIEAALSSI